MTARWAWIGIGAVGWLGLAPAGCVMRSGGRVADHWELVGPFRRFAHDGAAPPAPAEGTRQDHGTPSTESPGPQQAPGSDATPDELSAVSSNGFFSLRAADLDLGTNGPDSDEPVGPAIDPAEHGLFAPVTQAEDTFWYLDLGFRMGVTRLHSTEHRLDRRLQDPLKLDLLHVFERPVTPIDRKSEFGLTTGYVGIGRRETNWLTWNFYFGSGVGEDRFHDRWLTANLDVNFKYAFYYTGMTVDIYPWGLSQRGRYVSFKEHLKAGRPYLLTGIEVGYLKARGGGYMALSPVPLYQDDQKVEDWLLSYLLGCGWEVPINDRWAFDLSVHYTFHFYRPEEYNGWNLTYALRYRF